jgi:hypothetical protein
MTAQIAVSAAPDWAIQIWCDLTHIYIQLPSQNGPCVLEYPRDSHALSDILNLMKSRHAVEGASGPYLAPPPAIKRDARFTPVQRDGVRDLLRRKGIIGK